METQIIIVAASIFTFVGLGFLLNSSIKKHEKNMKITKKKKGKYRYMPQSKTPVR